jgi:hypothetical protein
MLARNASIRSGCWSSSTAGATWISSPFCFRLITESSASVYVSSYLEGFQSPASGVRGILARRSDCRFRRARNDERSWLLRPLRRARLVTGGDDAVRVRNSRLGYRVAFTPDCALAAARSSSRGQLGSWIEAKHDLVRLLVAPMSEPAPLAHDKKAALRQHTNRPGVVARSASVERTGFLQQQKLL